MNAAMAQSAIALALAAVLGGVIGFQRQYTQKPAGIRTHALVSLGSCAFATFSVLIPGDTRIAAGVITGVGFLGAGAIVRHGLNTRGLTTAASIWTAAAIGMGVGLGRLAWWPVYVTTVVLTLLVLSMSDELVMRLLPRRSSLDIRVDTDLNVVALDALSAAIGRCVHSVRIGDDIAITNEAGIRHASAVYSIGLHVDADMVRTIEAIGAIDGVLAVRIEEPVAPPN